MDAVTDQLSGTCVSCDGARWVDDPSACGDPEHCSPVVPCPECNPGGEE